MCIHAAVQTFLNILAEGIGRHGNDDGAFRIRTGKRPDCLCCTAAIHYRHLNIHQDQIIKALLRFGKPFNRFLSILGGSNNGTRILKQCSGNLQIDFIIFCQQNLLAGQNS